MKTYEKNTLEYYNSHAQSYADNSLNADMTVLYRWFMKELPAGAAILDLGCGSGRDSRYFLSQGCDVTAVDGSAALCRQAAQLTGLDVQCMLFSEINYSVCFDGVWACASLLHVAEDDIDAVIDRIAAALKPGGVFFTCFKQGSGEQIIDKRLYTYYSQETAAQLIERHPQFAVREIKITRDVMKGRETQTWINVLARKSL